MDRIEQIRKRLAEGRGSHYQKQDIAYLLERLDEAMRLIEWIRSMEIVEQMDRIDAFLAHKRGVIQ
jgi:hypothetical protein